MKVNIDISLVEKLIEKQFPEYSNLTIKEVEKQGHDNRTYRLEEKMLIRLPTKESYALKVPIEQKFLPMIVKHISINIPIPIPIPIRKGIPSKDYPYEFSIYEWLPGKSLNLIDLTVEEKNNLALDLAKFLKELHLIENIGELEPGQHNYWRGDNLSVYDKYAREQILKLKGIIDTRKAEYIWNMACNSKYEKNPVWIHGDFAIGNILIENGKLSGIIDFGCMATGDPSCDLVICWTYFNNESREIFVEEMNLDFNTWLRARGWALWKSTFELCNIEDKDSEIALFYKKIIADVINI